MFVESHWTDGDTDGESDGDWDDLEIKAGIRTWQWTRMEIQMRSADPVIRLGQEPVKTQTVPVTRKVSRKEGEIGQTVMPMPRGCKSH